MYQGIYKTINIQVAGKCKMHICKSKALTGSFMGATCRQWLNLASDYLPQRHLNFKAASYAATTHNNNVRGNYSKITNADISHFEKILDKHRVVIDPSELKQYNTDWMKSYSGCSELLLRPRTTEEVSAIVSYCNQRNLAICPQGGNTGLVGGSVPVFDEIILSTSLMNRVISLDTTSGVIVGQAGCVLEMLDNKLDEHGLMVPLDLGARGSCQIGGNISTNAGGLRLMRYGSLHGNVLGLEVVLANGEVLDCLSLLRKDNTGYDLKQLFIGAEGTLGIITKVALLCVPKPSSVQVAFLACKSFEDLIQAFTKAKAMLGEILSAFELIDQESLKAVQLHFKIKVPIEPITKHPFYILIETSGSNEQHDEEKLQHFVEAALNLGLIQDGGIYMQPSQIRTVWSIREKITAATLKDGYVYKYDISLPLNCLYDLVPHLRQHLGNKITRCNGFGHVGDGNIHINISTSENSQEVKAMLEPHIFEWVSRHRGSISAEHGLGQQKKNYIHFSKSKQAINVMKMLKNQFDPKHILNPYKVMTVD